MRRVVLLIALASVACAEDRWVRVRSGPFEVFSGAGDRVARERLNELEQFRNALGSILGKNELKLVWPLRLVISRKPLVSKRTIALGRDAYMTAIAEDEPLSAEAHKELARVLLAQNTARLPESIENGIVQLFSTLDVSGTHVTLGAPPPERTRDWARMQLLTVNEAYSGRTRVMINNLEQGADMDAACRNAFEKSAADIEKQLDAYIHSGAYQTAALPGRAINPTRNFHPEPIESAFAKLAVADVMLAAGDMARANTEYLALHGPEASEGLGFLALNKGDKTEAARLFQSAAESDSKNARMYVELATLTSEAPKARAYLRKAAELNAAWAEPEFRLARLEPNPSRKVELLKKATSLDPRNVQYWQELAKAEIAANLFVEAAKAWAGAERAAINAQERGRIHEARLRIEQQRADFEEAERKRKAEEQARDLQRIKDESMAEIHAAEAAANKKLNPDGAAVPKPSMWMDEANGNAKADGVLQNVQCLGKQARLSIVGADRKTTLLLVKDPAQIAISGGGEKAFACGPQKPPRRVSVQYIANPDPKRGTAGDATIIEFR